MNHSIKKAIIKVFRFRCRSCFRFEAIEDDTGGFWKFRRKPKPGRKTHCWAHDYKINWDGSQSACEYWEARLWWNLEEYKKYAKYHARRWWYEHVRRHIGGLRKPVPLRWVDYYDGMRDEIIPAGEPRCPYCGEMPYSTTQCQFCGQRFVGEKGNAAD